MFPEEDVIKKLLAEVCATQPSAIRGDRLLIEYGLDSARAIDLLLGLEATFDLHIPDEDARTMRTLDDVIAYVRKHVAAKGAK